MHSIKRFSWQIFGLIMFVALLTGCSAASASNSTTQAASVGTVKTITAVTSVSATGSAAAQQTVSLAWKTSGTVGAVSVKAGDHVTAGQVLMTIDPVSASTAELEAQATLSSSVKALNDLLYPSALKVAEAQQAVVDAQTAVDNLQHPTDTAVATAEQTVAKAQSTLETAQKTLANSKTVDLKYYQDQVNQAQDALTNAQQNATATDIGSLPVQLRQAQSNLQHATDVYNNAKDAFAKCPACLTVYAYDHMSTWAAAQAQYTDAVNQVEQIQMQIDQAQRQNATNVSTAQDNLTTATRNLAWAATGVDTVTVSVNQAAVKVAQAALTDAQKSLNELLNPDATKVGVAKATLSDAQNTLNTLLHPDATDVLAAKAKVAAAQDALAAYTLTASMDGEVLAVNCQPGDTVSTSQAAATLANLDHLRVDVQVDESDVSKVRVGDPVTVTVDALPDLALPGAVAAIDTVGTSSNGLVKYTVRVETTEAYSQVLSGMSASATIVTDTKTGVLAVPLAAVQYDTQGEYVNLVKSDGSLERVTVKSGVIQNGQVTVEGTLKSGDKVSLTSTSSTTTASSTSSTAGGPGGSLGALTGGGQPPSGGGPQP